MGAREYVLAHLLCLLDDEGAQSLLGRGGGDDEAEPDGEHDTEGNGGGTSSLPISFVPCNKRPKLIRDDFICQTEEENLFLLVLP